MLTGERDNRLGTRPLSPSLPGPPAPAAPTLAVVRRRSGEERGRRQPASQRRARRCGHASRDPAHDFLRPRSFSCRRSCRCSDTRARRWQPTVRSVDRGAANRTTTTRSRCSSSGTRPAKSAPRSLTRPVGVDPLRGSWGRDPQPSLPYWIGRGPSIAFRWTPGRNDDPPQNSVVTVPSSRRSMTPSNSARKRSMVSCSWTSFERWNSPTASCSARSPRIRLVASYARSMSA